MLRLADVERGDQRTREKLAPFELVRRAEKRLLLFSRLLADNAVSDHSGQISTDEQYALAEYLEELAFDLRDAEDARAEAE